MRIVGVDFGLKRIGLAITDEQKIIASPLPFVEASKQTEMTIKRLLAALEGYKIEKMVVGNPLHMDGRTSFLGDEVKHFVEKLQEHVDFPIVLLDERLSSVQAHRALKESNLSRKKRSKLVDSVAAVLILQSFLEQISSQDGMI
ncbi:MAG: putative pre-16S rRNA nuclease [Chlamydiales bacterium]|nr:putative pre-16S rRNA nuclease [Chlamydiales bacterium]MCH9635221.1 putative pre-16S rRNA nuclease [Chlamydiales bacterium]MCH9704381.1 Holliday junction resolvase RuvX [Chlamydiota bacterium]